MVQKYADQVDKVASGPEEARELVRALSEGRVRLFSPYRPPVRERKLVQMLPVVELVKESAKKQEKEGRMSNNDLKYIWGLFKKKIGKKEFTTEQMFSFYVLCGYKGIKANMASILAPPKRRKEIVVKKYRLLRPRIREAVMVFKSSKK